MTILYKNMDCAQLLVKEEDVIKLILEFLSTEHYHVTLRALEKESSVLNCDYSDEVLFLRELVLDGDFVEVLEFGKSFSSNPSFNVNFFNYIVLRQKFIELIYKKLHLGNSSEEDEDVNDVMKTLRSLESCCPSKEEYNNLCWLLTVPNLQSCEGFKNWKVDLSRLKCFNDLLTCLSDIMPSIRKNKGNAKVSSNNRLLQLIVKGLFYESCVDYCQSVVSSLSNEKKPVFSIKSQLLDNISDGFPSNLLSWVSSLPQDVFNLPFEHTDVAISLSNIKEKPSVLYTSDLCTSYDQLKFSESADYLLNEEKKPANIAEKVLANKQKLINNKKVDVNNSYNNNQKIINDEMILLKKNVKKDDSIQGNIKEQDIESISKQNKNENESKKSKEEIGKPKLNTSTKENKVKKTSTDEKYKVPSSHEKMSASHEVFQKKVDNKEDPGSISSHSTLDEREPVAVKSSVNQSVELQKSQDVSEQELMNRISRSMSPASQSKTSISSYNSMERSYEHADKMSSESSSHKIDDSEKNVLITNKPNQVQDKYVEGESKEKENKPDSKDVILGPVINGVRRPISSFVLTNSSSYGEQNEASRPSKKNKAVLQEKKLSSHEDRKSTPVDHNISRNISYDQYVEENHIEEAPTKLTEQNSLRHREMVWRYKPMSMIEDSQAVRSVAFTPDGSMYAVGANSKILRICMMAHPEADESDMLPRMSVMFKRNKYHRGSIYSMAWDEQGQILATGSNDKSIKLLHFDATTFKQVGDESELNIHQGTVRELAFVPNKRGLLISGGAGDGCVHMSDIISQKSTGTFDGHTGNVLTVFAGNGDLIATGGTDNTLRLWDLRSQRCIDVVMVGDSSPASVSLSGEDKYLASGQEDGSILLYDLVAGRTLQNFRLHQSDCRSVRFSPDSARLLTASYDSTISILHVNKDLEMSIPNHYIIGKHNDKVIQARWHPSEDYLLSSSADRTAVLWSRD